MMAGNTRSPRMKVAAVPDVEDGPTVLSIRSNTKKLKVQWVDAFEIDGVMYKIRASATPQESLLFTSLWRRRGIDLAMDYLLELLLAPDAYQALLTFKDLTKEHVEEIVKIAMRVITGASPAPN